MRYTLPLELARSEPIKAEVGMFVKGDAWDQYLRLIEGDAIDLEYFNTNLRYARMDDIIPSLPVTIKITGRVVHFTNYAESVRCEITTWDSNEEPVSFRGWLEIRTY